MSTNKRTLTIKMLSQVWRTCKANTAINRISITTRVRAIIIKVKCRPRPGTAQRTERQQSPGPVGCLEEVVAYGTKVFVGAGDAVAEDGMLQPITTTPPQEQVIGLVSRRQGGILGLRGVREGVTVLG